MRIRACVQQFTITSKAELTLPPSETATVLPFFFGNPLPILHGWVPCWYRAAGGHTAEISAFKAGLLAQSRSPHGYKMSWPSRDLKEKLIPKIPAVSGHYATAAFRSEVRAALKPPQAAGRGEKGLAEPPVPPREAQPEEGGCTAPSSLLPPVGSHGAALTQCRTQAKTHSHSVCLTLSGSGAVHYYLL